MMRDLETDGPIRLLLADDHAVLRTGLKLLLDNQEDMLVVGEAADGAAVLPLAEATLPDLILLDLAMPRLDGLRILPQLKQHLPSIRVLILTMHDDEGYVRQALASGAAGYVLKKAADVELITAIHAVMREEVYVHSSVTQCLLDDVLAMPGPEDGWSALSDREQQVLQLVALGHTGREIAAKLDLSVKTVDTYRGRGMEKLGLRSRAGLVRFALANDLME